MKFSDFKRKKVKTNYVRLLALALGLIVIFIFYFFIFSDQIKNLVSSEGKYNTRTKNLELQIKNSDLDEVLRLKKNLQSIDKQELDKVFSILPEERNIARLYAQMERLVQKNSFIPLKINISPVTSEELLRRGIREVDEILTPEEEGKNSKLAISLSIDGGDYLQFKKLLGDIEKNLRILDIKSIEFSPSTETYHLEIETYYRT